MTLDFQVEKWSDCVDDMRWLWPMHWEEVAIDKEQIPLNVWEEAYANAEKKGDLHIVTARDDEKIVGYYFCFVYPHLHYQQSLTAHTDVYFLHPAYRKGDNGTKLIRFMEQSLKELGVERIYTQTKVQNDKSKLFERLGWRRTEIVYSKYIGG